MEAVFLPPRSWKILPYFAVSAMLYPDGQPAQDFASPAPKLCEVWVVKLLAAFAGIGEEANL
jgi:hypothetical protein